MAIERVAVTGGNGKIGEAILRDCVEHGYHAINVARGKRREEVSDEYRTTDLLDSGDVYGSLAASDADAVVHMGTIPNPTGHPEHVTFESNAMSTYHVLEAATALGLEAVVLASSINAMGASYQDAPAEIEYLPVDEAHPLTPRDPYALGKYTAEGIADGFGRRPDTPQIASLRYPWVASGEELRERYAEADRSLAGLRGGRWNPRSVCFSYLHLADGASVARRAFEADLSGHEPFWTVAADTSADVRTAELVEEFYPEAEAREEFLDYEGLISIDKARTFLDWEPEHSWRDL
jgi:nucleoside-diphosphate-sugar epimerase